ncbi:MAG: ABC transporter permease, partial [Gemmatimonas sp.]
DEERAFHLSLEAMQREHASRGALTGADAQYAARKRFGNTTVIKEETRAMAGLNFFDLLQQDLRFAWRSFRRTPAFTLVAASTLAIGIGANTAIFSAIDALLLRPLPFVEPERLMKISMVRPARPEQPGSDDMVWSYPKWVVFRDNQTVFSKVSLFTEGAFTVRAGGDAERVHAEVTDHQYFTILGVTPALGRNFLPEEDSVASGQKVVALSYNYWQRRFNADAKVLGTSILIKNESYQIIGVWPEGFRGISGNVDLWIPLLQDDPTAAKEPWGHSYTQIGRLKPGVTPQQARVATTQLGALVDRTYPHPTFKTEHSGAIARELDTVRVDPVLRRSLLILMGAVALVLLIACANVANLFLVRAAGRGREIAVRLAVGASRTRIARQLITESLLLSAIGGVMGVAIGWVGVRALSSLDAARALDVRKFSGVGAVNFATIELNITAVAVAALLSMLTGVVFGVLPAWKGTRPALAEELKSGKTRARQGSWQIFNSRSVIAAVEIALAIVLLAGSGLMLKSLGHLMSVDPGFESKGLLTLRFNAPDGTPRDSAPAFYEQVLTRISAIPGVTSVALQDCPPLNGGCNTTSAVRRDRPEGAPDGTADIGVHWVSPNWTSVMHVPLKSGRMFTANDRAGVQKVVVISESAAKRMFPGEDPLGKPISVNQGGFHNDTARIVGIVGDIRYGTLDSLAAPDVYLSHLQSGRPRMMIMVRTAGDPLTLTRSVRVALREVAADLPAYDIRTMDSRVADSTAYAKFGTLLLVMFGGVALLLAALGTYGVIAFSVSERTREIGIRVALGASTGQVVRMIVKHALSIAVVGAAVGLVIAAGTTQVLQSVLYDVRASDPATFGSIILVLILAVITASWIPARRAARIQPTEALRQE